MKKSPSLPLESRTDPVQFVRTFLTDVNGNHADPHPGQEHILRNIQPLTVGCCGRQFGKSVCYGWYGTWFGATHANKEIYVIAPTVDQSRIIFNEIAGHFRKPPLNSLVRGKIKQFPFPELNLSNGTNVYGRGANSPEFIRGKKIHLALLDEAAFFKDGVIRSVIEPMFIVTGREAGSALIMISTPFGTGDFFDYYMRARTQTDGRAFAFHYTSYDNPHADRAYLDRVKEEYGEDSLLFRTEYLAEFVDDDLSVFPSAQIKRAIERFPYRNFPIAPLNDHRYVSGTDLANVRDYFVQTILDVTNPQLVPLVHMDRLQKKGYAHYKEIVRTNYATFNHPRILIDATSLGESVVEDLADTHAEGYKFTTGSKYEIVQELARMFSENRIALPNDRTIIDELRYFTYEITPSKTLKMEAKRGHDDIVMSLALAAHLACIPRSIGLFRPVLSERVPPKPTKPSSPDPWADLFRFDAEDRTT